MTSIQTRKRRRRWIIAGVVILALLIAGFLIVQRVRTQAELVAAQANTGETVAAFTGDLAANATASGTLSALREARLALAQSGEVSELLVVEGQRVAEGEPLLTLDDAALQRALATAEQALIIQEASLADLLAPPEEASVIAAEAAVTSAQAQLDDLLAGPSEEDIEASDANLRAAQANVWAASEQVQLARSSASESEIASAQAELIAALGNQEQTQELYDKLIECFDFNLPDGGDFNICPGQGNPEEQTRFNLATADANAAAARARLDALLAGPDGDAVSIAQAGYASAAAQLEAAEANHELLLKGAGEAQIAAAEASLAQAQSNLDLLLDGPGETQLALAQIAVDQARLNVEQAQDDLDEATLRAPFDGVITAVNVSAGELANGVLLEMAAEGDLEVVLQVDELDIGSLQEGQAATITLETWPNEELSGEIARIAPVAATDGSALVVYDVYVRLGDTDLPVRAGMTANADLQTANLEEVLLLPNQAINADRSSGVFTVNLVTMDDEGNEVVEAVTVSIGLRDARNTQILDGLQDGDRVRVGNTAPVFDFGSNEGPPPGEGNDGPPGFGG